MTTRFLFGLMLMIGIVPAMAQNNDPKSVAEVGIRAQESYSKASDLQAVASINEWCKVAISTFSFPERDRLMVQALKYLQEDKPDEYAANVMHVKSLDEMDEKISKAICTPR